MGNRSVKLSYLHTLPLDIKHELLYYVSDIHNILNLHKLNMFNDHMKYIKKIDYGDAYKYDVKDVVFTVNNILQFTSLEVCHVPIAVAGSKELCSLAQHPTLREFSVTIDKDEMSIEFSDVFDNILDMIKTLIMKRKSINDMKIFICPQFKVNYENVAPFFNHQLDSAVDRLLYANFDLIKDAFSTTPIKTIYTTPVIFMYVQGNLLIDAYFSKLDSYRELLNLLHTSDNLSSLIYALPFTDTSNVDVIEKKIDKLYITGAVINAHQNAFRLLLKNVNITKLEFKMDIICRVPERKMCYECCLGFDIMNVLMQQPPALFMRKNPIQIIYPFHTGRLTYLFNVFPNINEIGFFDNLETYTELEDVIKDLLEKVDVVHIFTLKSLDYYDELLSRYSGLLVIEDK